jgi:peptidoglycan/xylan/chitin deacetylase (PgdA/CDA1 family)
MAVKHNHLSNETGAASNERSYDTQVYLDENDIKYLDERGVIIGSHSSTHRVLSECDDEELKQEVLENKLYLEGLLGKKVEHLALPYGKREHYNERVLKFCNSVGHNYVYSTNPSYFSTANPPRGLRTIPRISFLNESKEEMLFYINRPLFRRIDI